MLLRSSETQPLFARFVRLDPPGSNPPSFPSLSLLQEYHGKLLRTTPSAPSLKLSPTGSDEPHRRQPPLAAACKDLDLQPQGKTRDQVLQGYGSRPSKSNAEVVRQRGATATGARRSLLELLEHTGAGSHRARSQVLQGYNTFRETREGVRQCRRRGWHCYRGAVPARSPL